MTLKIKTIRGGGYYYNDVSKRVAGKVKTTSTYIGPVNPKRKRRGGEIGIGTFLANPLVGSAALGGMAAMGRLKTTHYKEKPYVNGRARSVANQALRELYAKHLMDDTHPDKFEASFNRLPQEMKDEVLPARKAIFDQHRAATLPRTREIITTKPMSPDMKAFNDRLAVVRAEQAARAATQAAPVAPAAPSAPDTPQAEAADAGVSTEGGEPSS